MRKLRVLAGLSAALFVSGIAHAAFEGLELVRKVADPPNERLFICNFFLVFSDPGDRVLSIWPRWYAPPPAPERGA